MRHLACERYPRLSGVLPELVDDRVGLIRYLGEVERQPGAPRLFHYTALACNTGAFAELENFHVGSGAARDRGAAMAKAVGEAVERYCSALFDLDALPLATAEEAPFTVAAPGDFALHAEQQYGDPSFPFMPFTPQTPVRWVAALDPLEREVVHVPAAMVFVPYKYYTGTGDTPIVQPISTGLAAHCSPIEAAISGVCEVVERDAFTLTWQARISPPKLRVESLSIENRALVAELTRFGGQVTVLDITLDHGISTILSVYRHAGTCEPALVAAASCSPEPEEAVRKSLEELEHTRHWSRILKETIPPLEADEAYANVEGQAGHLRFYGEEENAQLGDFLVAGECERSFSELRNLSGGGPLSTLHALCERIRGVGHRALLAHVTSPDVAQLGMHVVRAVVPGFHALFSGHHIRCLGGTRLWSVPQQLGYPGVRPETGDNPAPHPYP